MMIINSYRVVVSSLWSLDCMAYRLKNRLLDNTHSRCPHIVCGACRVYVAVACPSVCPSVCPVFSSRLSIRCDVVGTRGVVVNFDLWEWFPRPRSQQRESLRPQRTACSRAGDGCGGSPTPGIFLRLGAI